MDDGTMSVQLAQKGFQQGVDALLEPQVWWDGHEVRRVPGLYRRVRDALTGKRSGFRSVAGSRPPCDLHAVDWLRRLDGVVRRDWVCRAGVEYGLRELAAAQVGPDQVSVILDRTNVLQGFVAEALDIVGDVERPIPLRRKCPAVGCEALFRYTPDGDRKWALLADPATGLIHCLVCRAEWPTERWGLLAEMLNA